MRMVVELSAVFLEAVLELISSPSAPETETMVSFSFSCFRSGRTRATTRTLIALTKFETNACNVKRFIIQIK